MLQTGIRGWPSGHDSSAWDEVALPVQVEIVRTSVGQFQDTRGAHRPAELVS
jgi:hypothetical protein